MSLNAVRSKVLGPYLAVAPYTTGHTGLIMSQKLDERQI